MWSKVTLNNHLVTFIKVKSKSLKTTLGVDIINVLCTVFMPVAPQSIRTQSSCQYPFTLWGFTRVKAVRRTLMKLSLGGVEVAVVRTVTSRFQA